MKKLSQFLKLHISGTPEAISLKFGMWSAEVGGHVHSKNRLVSSRQHRATEVISHYIDFGLTTCIVFLSKEVAMALPQSGGKAFTPNAGPILDPQLM